MAATTMSPTMRTRPPKLKPRPEPLPRGRSPAASTFALRRGKIFRHHDVVATVAVARDCPQRLQNFLTGSRASPHWPQMRPPGLSRLLGGAVTALGMTRGRPAAGCTATGGTAAGSTAFGCAGIDGAGADGVSGETAAGSAGFHSGVTLITVGTTGVGAGRVGGGSDGFGRLGATGAGGSDAPGGPLGGALRGGPDGGGLDGGRLGGGPEGGALDGGGELGGALVGAADAIGGPTGGAVRGGPLGGGLDGGGGLGGALRGGPDGGGEPGGALRGSALGTADGPIGRGVGAPSGAGAPGAAGRAPGAGIGMPGIFAGGSIASFLGTPIAVTCWTSDMNPPRRAVSAGSAAVGAASGEAGGVTFSPVHSRNAPHEPQNVSASALLKPHFLQTIIDRRSTSRRELQCVDHVGRLRCPDQPVERARVDAGDVVHIHPYCHTRLGLTGEIRPTFPRPGDAAGFDDLDAAPGDELDVCPKSVRGAPDAEDLDCASHQRAPALLRPVLVEIHAHPATEPGEKVIGRNVRLQVGAEVIERRDQGAEHLVEPAGERLREPILLIQRGQVWTDRVRGRQPRHQRAHRRHAGSTRT